MTTTTTSAALIPVAPVFTNTERLALAGFLAGYSALTGEAYALDLRQSASWCHLCRRRHKWHNSHSFAVASLLDAYVAGQDAQARLALRAPWLGHVDPAA